MTDIEGEWEHIVVSFQHGTACPRASEDMPSCSWSFTTVLARYGLAQKCCGQTAWRSKRRVRSFLGGLHLLADPITRFTI